MNTSVEIGFFSGLLLAFDVVAIFYGFRIFDAVDQKRRSFVMILLLCFIIVVNTTSMGFINGLAQ